MKYFFLSLIISSFFTGLAEAQVRIKEDSFGRYKSAAPATTRTKTAADGISLREIRKVGLGVKAAGIAGVLGFALELNFTPEVSFSTGWGMGDDYQTLHMQLKKTLLGRRFLPYIAGGLARWYSVNEGNYSKSSPEFFAKKFLSAKERRTGEFAENIIYPAAGIQFLNIDGDYAGLSVYAEALIMMDLDDLNTEPTAGLGMTYYF